MLTAPHIDLGDLEELFSYAPAWRYLEARAALAVGPEVNSEDTEEVREYVLNLFHGLLPWAKVLVEDLHASLGGDFGPSDQSRGLSLRACCHEAECREAFANLHKLNVAPQRVERGLLSDPTGAPLRSGVPPMGDLRAGVSSKTEGPLACS